MSRLKLIITISFLLVLSSIALFPAHAATLTVTDCSASAGAAGRLAETITAASSGDTIVFSCGTATIPFSAEINITESLTIDGGNTITLDGGSSVRMFDIINGNTVTINNLTFQNGFYTGYGGAISISAVLADITVNINGSYFSNNHSGIHGGAIHSSTAEYNIFLSISNSHFSGNSADKGGAIAYYSANSDNDFGTLTISNSTFTNNVATEDGGAIEFFTGEANKLTISNSTFTNNMATDGGAIRELSGGSFFDHDISGSIFTNNTCEGLFNDGGGNTRDAASVGCPGDIPTVLPPTEPNEPTSPIITPVFVLGCALDTTDGVELAGAPDNTYCRVLMRNGGVVSYSGAIPSQLIGLGVILAVDVYMLQGGQTIATFPNYSRVCLAGEGRLFYMDSRNAPRVSIELASEVIDGLTCGWIPASGTLILTN